MQVNNKLLMKVKSAHNVSPFVCSKNVVTECLFWIAIYFRCSVCMAIDMRFCSPGFFDVTIKIKFDLLKTPV
jgi:hypothetical protein